MEKAGIRIEITPFVEIDNGGRLYKQADRRIYEIVQCLGASTYQREDIKRLLLQMATELLNRHETLEEMYNLNLLAVEELNTRMKGANNECEGEEE